MWTQVSFGDNGPLGERVTVVTAMDDGSAGITASSLASVSLNPLRVLVCVSKKLYTHGVIESGGRLPLIYWKEPARGMFCGLAPEVQDRFEDIVTQTVSPAARFCRAYWVGSIAWWPMPMTAATIRYLWACRHAAQAKQVAALLLNRHWRNLRPGVVLERRGE